MNLKTISGSLAAETACPNGNQDFLFRHSKKARVTGRPPTRVNQPRLSRRTTYLSFSSLGARNVSPGRPSPPSQNVDTKRPVRLTLPGPGKSIATVGISASGATGSTLSHFFSSRPSHENPNLPTRTRDVVCRFLFALRPSYACGSHSPIFSQTAGPDFPFHTFTKPLISRRETNFSS